MVKSGVMSLSGFMWPSGFMWLSGFMWPRGFMWLKVAKNAEKWGEGGEKVGKKWWKVVESGEKL